MGHGPALHVETYAHCIESVAGQRWPDLDSMIRQARSDPDFGGTEDDGRTDPVSIS
jgi:hypothetical protein